MRPLNVLCLLVIAFAVCACATKPVDPVPPQPTVETKQTVDVDPSLIQDCDQLKPLAVRAYSKQETVTLFNGFANKYSVCARRQHDLSTIAKKAFNIPATPASAVVVTE
jgi:hypothetical protein